MEITNVRIRIVNGNEKLKAYASVTIDDALVVNDIKLVNGKLGYFLSMPSKKFGEDQRKDIVHPIKTEIRDEMTNKVVEAYTKALQENGEVAETAQE